MLPKASSVYAEVVESSMVTLSAAGNAGRPRFELSQILSAAAEGS
jgi:hypothetical protein